MQTPSTEHVARLVQPDRVHRSVYTDPALFEREMTHLFGRAWLLLGHESQVKTPGRFFTTRMGREPVIVVRTEDGAVRVLVNRCTHRGAAVCSETHGEAKPFVCPYHGWTYASDGSLRFVPTPEGYRDDPCGSAALGLRRVPRVASYRGFIFASLAAEGPSLTDFLGYSASSFDDFVDRAPGGELEVAGGVFKHAYAGNWKLVLENHLDGMHPAFVHQSSVHAAGAVADPAGEEYATIALKQMRQNGAPKAVWERIGIWVTERGHGVMGDYHDDSRLVAGLDNPIFAEYRARLVAEHGEARAQRILGVTRFNTIVYPNASFMSQFRQLRLIHPIAVDRTVVYTYSFRMPKAPPRMFADTVAFANVVNGTASWVLTDDLEVYERVQRSLADASAAEWVYLGRGFGGDAAGEAGTRRGATGTSEVFIRGQMAAWRDYMTRETA
jgi:phenylpropionate dioxygenase-like ring-hydroxylating dioxygenase large terminal subunit